MLPSCSDSSSMFALCLQGLLQLAVRTEAAETQPCPFSSESGPNKHRQPNAKDPNACTCRVCFSLLSEEEQQRLSPGEPCVTEVQLISRHWRITSPSSGQVQCVDGEGVVGLYPHLKPGKSCWHSLWEPVLMLVS